MKRGTRGKRPRWLPAAVALLCALLAPTLAAQTLPPQRADKTVSTRLANGLEVVLSEARQQPVFALNVRYRVGARNDPADLDELSHLVEHLSFHDAHHPGLGGLESAALAGVDTNAFTGTDETVYVHSGPVGALARVLWLERQRMAFALATLTTQDVVTERGILDKERSSIRVDRTGGMFWRLVDDALYPAQHPYAPRPERGCIVHCELRHVQWLMQRGYRPDNAQLVVVGDFDADALLPAITRQFGSIDNPSVRLPEQPRVAARPGSQHITIAAPIARPHLELFWEVPDALHSKLEALLVLRAELNLLLEHDLEDTVGLATDVTVGVDRRELGWLWVVGVDLLPGVDQKFVERRALAFVEHLCGHVMPIEAAREVAITGLLRTWDSPSSRASLLAGDRGFGFDLGRTVAALRHVSAEEVEQLARQFLRGKPKLSVHEHRAIGAARGGELYREAP